MSRENPYMPRLWTRPSNYIGQTWEGWLVFLGRNRDSDLLTNHNFETALNRLEAVASDYGTPGEGLPAVCAVRESHWACGWVEWIAIHHSDTRAVALANEMADDLDGYPILDEDRYSDKEWESASESWASMSVRDRYELIKRSGNCSVFAARHDYMPDDDRVQEILRSWA